MEDRLTSLEGKMDAIAGLRQAIGDFRTDVNRQFAEGRTEMNRRFGEVENQVDQLDRRLDVLDLRVERHFMWMVGIQFTVLLAVIVALIQIAPR